VSDRPASVRLDAPWPRLPDGDYDGVIVNVQRGPSPWPPRKLSSWEKAEGRTRRKDWCAFYHVELCRAASAEHHRHLTEWVAARGRRPIVFHPCHYYTLENSVRPLPPARSSNLWRLLTLARPGTSMVGEDVPFTVPVGLAVHVRLGLTQKDRDRDTVPDEIRYSCVRKVLSVLPAGSLQVSPSTRQQLPEMYHQHSPPEKEHRRALAESVNGILTTSRASRREIVEQATGVPTGAVEVLNGAFAAPDARTLVAAYVPRPPLSSQERVSRIRALGPEAMERGPCEHCGRPKVGRPGENSRCVECA
jgi:hypothetical protein